MKRYESEKLWSMGPVDGFIIHTPDDRQLIDTHPQTIVRELNRLNDEIEEKRKDIVYLATEKAKLENRIKRLEEMYEGEPGERPDLLGSNVMGLLKRELNSAQQRIKRLEEAGDAVAAIIGPPGSAHWADENQVDAAWNNWTKAKEDK